MINRRGAVWQEEIDRLPPKAFLEQLYLMGFGGLILDPRAKETPSMKAVARQLAAAGLTPLSDGQGCSFYDLRGLASKFRARHEPAQWERMRTLTSLPVYARCWTRILPQDADGIRWCPSKTGMVDLVNTDADPVEVELSLRARMSSAGLRITGSVLRGDSAEVQNGLTSSRRFTLPPGSHRLTFHELGDAPRVDSPHGSVWFGVEQFSIQPATDPTPVAGRSRP